jgi:hypothetical protein
MKDAVNNLESTLCDKCSVLRFDDMRLGGYKVQNDHGEEILRFDNECDAWGRRLWLDYMHHDSLPELPHLGASAEAGCVFCAMLRSAALELNFIQPAQVTFSLCYDWDPRWTPKCGLGFLIAQLRVSHDVPQPESVDFLFFTVDCEEGNH